jgi:hypothetical protein
LDIILTVSGYLRKIEKKVKLMKKILAVVINGFEFLAGVILLGTTLIITNGFISNDYYGNFFERLYNRGLIPVLIIALILIVSSSIFMHRNLTSFEKDEDKQ